MHWNPLRSPLLPLLLLLVAGAPAAAPAQELGAVFAAELALERQLLAEDLRLYAAARREQRDAFSRWSAALGAIDQRIESRTVAVAGLEELEAEAATSEVALEAANRRSSELRRRLVERLRRTGLLEDRIEAVELAAQGLSVDALSGGWRLELAPGRERGRLELRFAGTAVEGTYSFESGESGTVRGMTSGGLVRLEQTDSKRGRVAVWEGEIDPVRRRAAGRWTATELGAGPAAGTWSADKLESPGFAPAPPAAAAAETPPETPESP